MFLIVLPFFAQNASKNVKFCNLHELTKCSFFKGGFGAIFEITVALPVYEIKAFKSKPFLGVGGSWQNFSNALLNRNDSIKIVAAY